MTLDLTINEALKWLSSLSISMYSHSSAGRQCSVRYTVFPLTPTSWDLGPHQYLFGGKSVLNKYIQIESESNSTLFSRNQGGYKRQEI